MLNPIAEEICMLTPVLESATTQASWSSLFQRRALQPFPSTRLEVLEGAIPSGLRGSLYRVGPALFERGGERIHHWFDGDGAMLAVHFQENQGTATYRFVETAGYVAEGKAEKFLFGGYDRIGNWRHRDTKNVANTSVLAIEDRLWALWEGGQPYSLDLETLETIAEPGLAGVQPNQTFSAHPKRDPVTGDIYNFGLSFGRKPKLHLYRCDRRGQVTQQGHLELDATPLIHDFVMVGPYLIFCISPVFLSVFPLLFRQQSYSEALRWQPQRGTQLLIFDRHTLELVSRGEADPWFQWHFGNGYLSTEQEVVLDVVRYADFQINTFLQEVPTGHPQTPATGQLWRLYLEPKRAKVLRAEPLSTQVCEFPVVHPHRVGQPHRYTYLAAQSGRLSATDLFDAIAAMDHQTNTLQLLDLGGDRYPSEPIVAPNPNRPEESWVLSVVYNGKEQTSEVWVMNAQQIEDGPVCRLALPSPVALSFHGTWRAT
jgi:carotenoid cleavage dioxygenase-like enzyme